MNCFTTTRSIIFDRKEKFEMGRNEVPADESRLSWTRRGQPSSVDSDDEKFGASELWLWRWCGAWPAASVDPSQSRLLWCWTGGQDRARVGRRHSVHVGVALVSTRGGRREWRYSSLRGIRWMMSPAVSGLLCWHGEFGAVSGCFMDSSLSRQTPRSRTTTEGRIQLVGGLGPSLLGGL